VADGRSRVIAVEAAIAAVFVVVVAAGVTGPAWLLVAGLAGHGVKDLWQHRRQYVANTRWLPSVWTSTTRPMMPGPVAAGLGLRLAAAGTADAARTGPRRRRCDRQRGARRQARDLGHQQGQADPAHDAVDRGDHAGSGEQHPRGPGPQPHRGHRGAGPLLLGSLAEELVGLGDQVR
jgi:hypothetical protein